MTYLLGIKVLLPVCVLLEELAGTMAEQLMVGNLELERTVVPCIVQVDIVGVDERQFFVFGNKALNSSVLSLVANLTH